MTFDPGAWRERRSTEISNCCQTSAALSSAENAAPRASASHSYGSGSCTYSAWRRRKSSTSVVLPEQWLPETAILMRSIRQCCRYSSYPAPSRRFRPILKTGPHGRTQNGRFRMHGTIFVELHKYVDSKLG